MTIICTKTAIIAIAMFAAPLAAQTTNCMSLGGGFVTCNTTGGYVQQNNAAMFGMMQANNEQMIRANEQAEMQRRHEENMRQMQRMIELQARCNAYGCPR